MTVNHEPTTQETRYKGGPTKSQPSTGCGWATLAKYKMNGSGGHRWSPHHLVMTRRSNWGPWRTECVKRSQVWFQRISQYLETIGGGLLWRYKISSQNHTHIPTKCHKVNTYTNKCVQNVPRIHFIYMFKRVRFHHSSLHIICTKALSLSLFILGTYDSVKSYCRP